MFYQIPEHCIAGSTLENISFEVIDSKGDVDGTFHDDEKCGQFHTLVVKSESHQMDDSIRYALKHGRCKIASLPLPQIEGLLCFKAFYSQYTELYCDVEVGKKSCVYCDYHFIRKIADFFLQISLVRAPNVDTDENEVQSSDGKLMLLPNSPFFKNGNVGNLLPLVKYNEVR